MILDVSTGTDAVADQSDNATTVAVAHRHPDNAGSTARAIPLNPFPDWKSVTRSTHPGAEKHACPQHKAVGKTACCEKSKYRCVVDVGFHKTSLYEKRSRCNLKKKEITAIVTTVFLTPRGCRVRTVLAGTVDTVGGGGSKGDPQLKVVEYLFAYYIFRNPNILLSPDHQSYHERIVFP